MTTSGVSTFNYNRNQIIKSALRKIGAIAAGETPNAQLVTDSSDALNIMVKAWDATGIHIWTESEALLFLQPSQISYFLGGTTTDHCADITTTPANITTLSASAASGASTVSVTSASGMASGDQFGVTLNSGTVFWTTINGAPSGTTITLTAPLTGAANSGVSTFSYATAITRPLRVPAGRRYNYISQIDTPLIPFSRLDYRNQPNKTTTGTPTQYFYDPRGGANTQGLIWVWPAPYDASNGLKFTWYRPLQDFTNQADTPDLPNEWIDALIWNLAKKMAPEFDCTPQRYQMIATEAATSMDLALGWDREPESTYFGVNFDQR